MISPHLLEIVRCPLDPQTRLALEGERLVCTRCGVRFLIQDGFPKLIAEEGELPPGLPSIEQLPCQCAKRGEAKAP